MIEKSKNRLKLEKKMKKNIIIAVVTVLMLTSCGTYAGSGAANGAYFGSILGSAIGGLNGGYRGSDAGTIIGMAGGALIGAAIGDAQDKAVQHDRQQYLEEKARLKARRDARERKDMKRDFATRSYEDSESGYDAAGTYDDRIDLDFGDSAPMESTFSATPSTVVAGPNLIVRNARFFDENGDGVISRGERCDIVFEVFNDGDATAYNVEPTVIETTRNKHILVSPTILVESIGAHKGVRYTARVVADSMLKNGTASFVIKVLSNGTTIDKVLCFDVTTRK